MSPFNESSPEFTFHNAAVLQGDHCRSAACWLSSSKSLTRWSDIALAPPVPTSIHSRTGWKHGGSNPAAYTTCCTVYTTARAGHKGRGYPARSGMRKLEAFRHALQRQKRLRYPKGNHL